MAGRAPVKPYEHPRARRLRAPLLVLLWWLLAFEAVGGLVIFVARLATGTLPGEMLHVAVGAAFTLVYAAYQWPHWTRVCVHTSHRASRQAGDRLDDMKLISVVLSFRNEEQTIPEMVERLEKSLAACPEDYELIFVNDASTDRSLELLSACHARNPRVRVITLSRRFGVEPAIFAGLAYSRGDAVITIDADLQDPPEIIPELIARWRRPGGPDVVYTVRTARDGESWLKLLLTRIAYRVVQSLAEVHIPLNAGDFRLMSRRVVDTLLDLREPNTYLRGLVQWVGFRREPFYYHRLARRSGASHFGALSRGALATLFYGITGFSALPVYGVFTGGLVFWAVSSVVLAGLAISWAFGGPSGVLWWSLALATWFWASLMTAVGIVGLYVTRSFRNTLARPRYLVESSIGFAPDEIPPAAVPPRAADAARGTAAR